MRVSTRTNTQHFRFFLLYQYSGFNDFQVGTTFKYGTVATGEYQGTETHSGCMRFLALLTMLTKARESGTI